MYGAKTPSRNQRGQLNYKFVYRGIVYITDSTCRREVTSWAVPGSGLDVPLKQITSDLQRFLSSVRPINPK